MKLVLFLVKRVLFFSTQHIPVWHFPPAKYNWQEKPNSHNSICKQVKITNALHLCFSYFFNRLQNKSPWHMDKVVVLKQFSIEVISRTLEPTQNILARSYKIFLPIWRQKYANYQLQFLHFVQMKLQYRTFGDECTYLTGFDQLFNYFLIRYEQSTVLQFWKKMNICWFLLSN